MSQVRLAVILAGVALLAGLAVWAGLPAIEHGFAILGFGGLGLVVLVHIPPILLMGLAWWWIGRPHARPALFVMARLVRDAAAELLPFSQLGGFAASVRLLSLRGVPARAGGFSLFADLLMEFATKILYAIAGLVLLAHLRPGASIPSYLVPILAVLGGLLFLAWWARGLLRHALARFLSRWPAWNGVASFLVADRLVPSALLHGICWAFGGMEAWVTLRLMGVPVTIAEALIIDSFATGLRTFGFWMPGALGVQEAAYVLACAALGLGAGQALALSLVRRVRDILLGVAGLGLWQSLEMQHARALRNLEAATGP